MNACLDCGRPNRRGGQWCARCYMRRYRATPTGWHLAEWVASVERERLLLLAVAPPEEAEEWQALATEFGYSRTRAAVAMGLKPEVWRALGPLPDVAVDMLRRGYWR